MAGHGGSGFVVQRFAYLQGLCEELPRRVEIVDAEFARAELMKRPALRGAVADGFRRFENHLQHPRPGRPPLAEDERFFDTPADGDHIVPAVIAVGFFEQVEQDVEGVCNIGQGRVLFEPADEIAVKPSAPIAEVRRSFERRGECSGEVVGGAVRLYQFEVEQSPNRIFDFCSGEQSFYVLRWHGRVARSRQKADDLPLGRRQFREDIFYERLFGLARDAGEWMPAKRQRRPLQDVKRMPVHRPAKVLRDGSFLHIERTPQFTLEQGD